ATGHAPAGEAHVKGLALSNEAGQPYRAPIDQRDTPPATEHAEDGVARGDAHVAPQRQLEPAGNGVTLDGGDDGFVEQHARRAHGPVAVRCGSVAPARRDRLEVGAGTELAAGARGGGGR